LAIMPKHKGTDKLQADLKTKIARLKKQSEDGAKKHGAHHHADLHSHIEKEGAAQIILIGPPNTGKSSLLESLTHAKPIVADYSYSTHDPLAGMMTYETVHFQLIDTPAISEEQFPPYLPNLIRQADLVALVCDISDIECEKGLEIIFKLLEEKGIVLTPHVAETIENPRFLHKKTLLVAHKYLDGDWENALEVLKKRFSDFRIIPTSILDDESLIQFKAAVFQALNIIRVYTKRVGHEPDFVDPIILPIGGTVEDAAVMLHKDFAYKLQFAKIWGKDKFEGQRVKNNYILSDGDIIEFHI
jgi:uncharacterized protein